MIIMINDYTLNDNEGSKYIIVYKILILFILPTNDLLVITIIIILDINIR